MKSFRGNRASSDIVELFCADAKLQKELLVMGSDEATSSESSAGPIAVRIDPARRWEVYSRLRSLGISCQYRTGSCLTVRLDCPLKAIQYRCVLKQLTGTRAELISWLQTCWHQSN